MEIGLKTGMEIKNDSKDEGFKDHWGLVKPFMFGERLGLIQLEVPQGLGVSPHAHIKEDALYCLGDEQDVIPKNKTGGLSSEIAMPVPSNTEIDVKNRSNVPVNAQLVASSPIYKLVEEIEEIDEILTLHESKSRG
ncbi:MAG: hypothetical protein ACT6FE_07385 [Methanosarcinaceae archaeon]